MNKRTQATYRTQVLQNATGPELVAACFREAQTQLAEARRQIEAGTAASSYGPLERVRKIYTHLYGTVDLEQGGEMATSMQSLYAYVIERTMTVASSYDVEMLSLLEKINTDMLGAWSKVSVRETPSAPPSAGPVRVRA